METSSAVNRQLLLTAEIPSRTLNSSLLQNMRRACAVSKRSASAAPSRSYVSAPRLVVPQRASEPHIGHHANCPCAMMSDKPYYNRVPLAEQLRHANATMSPVGVRTRHQSFSTAPPTAAPPRDYAFELATANIRFGLFQNTANLRVFMSCIALLLVYVVLTHKGKGVTKEVGMDLVDMSAKNVAVFTDANLARLSPVQTVLQSLTDNKVKFTLYDKVRVEPTDGSMKAAIKWAQEGRFDAYVAVGGGSVIDTCKVANLYATYPADFLDYVNPPIGKGKPVPGPVKPLIAIPTTAGTGSETTGVAIFDLESMHAKTGIAHRRLKPTLGLVDPENTKDLPPAVVAASGFDVLCHSLESLTAIHYDSRPLPERPLLRPAYQGSNPISDIWSRHALEMCAKYLPTAFDDPAHEEARTNMILAATYAGIGFGNAGVHLCHGMSYPVAGMVRTYRPEGYNVPYPLIPHGISVIMHAPAVFKWTASASPQRHRMAAQMMGVTGKGLENDQDIGKVLADKLREIMRRLKVPNGLKALGFKNSDVDDLVKGALPQHRVIKLAPRPVEAKDLAYLFEDSMTVY